MTRRRAACQAVAAMLAALLLTGCAGDSRDGADGDAPSASASSDGPADARDPDAADQSTPGRAAATYFNAVSGARFADACAVLAPVVRARYASAGQDCQTALSELFDQPTRTAIGRVAADDSAVEVTGDTAVVPGAALSRTDLSDGADRPTFPDVRASRQDGRWYLVL